MILFTDEIPYNNEITYVAELLNAKVYFVGGTVRDLLLKKPVHDIDIVVFNIPYTVFATNLKKHLKAHSISFKDNVRIIKNLTIIDISKPRGKTLLEDLKLRDFTINSMAITLNGQLINFSEDLQNKCINIQYNNAFVDDPLRILRAYRFASELGFFINEITLNKIFQHRKLISNVAIERIYEELYKTFTGKYFKNIYISFIESQLFNIIFNIHNENISTEFTKICINKFFDIAKGGIDPDNNFIYIIIFFSIYSYIHKKNDETIILNNIKKIIIVKKHFIFISKILNLLKTLLHTNINTNRLNHIIFENLSLISNVLLILKILGKSEFNSFKDCKKIYYKLQYIYNMYDTSKLNEISGKDLKNLGIPEGVLFGKLLKRAQYYLVIGKANTKEDSLQKINKLWRKIYEIC
jgi:tRNA nucleotidyltransferase/poly(A) polymerase